MNSRRRRGAIRSRDCTQPVTLWHRRLGGHIRTRRTTTATVTAIAVMTLSAAGVGAAVRVHPASPARFVAASGGDRIAFPEGIRVRYPAGWSLVEFGGTLTS